MAQPLILIVEDDPAWQEMFAEMIADAGFRSIVVSSYGQAVIALSQRRYVLAVVDISLSLPDHADRGGVEVLREIVKLPGRLPTIVVTGYASIDLAIETLAELNAVHFFRKEDFNRREFLQTVKREALADDLLQTLSNREWEVLKLMGDGKTNKQIAEVLMVSVNTVKKHAQNIYTKLNVNTRAAAVGKAVEQDK